MNFGSALDEGFKVREIASIDHFLQCLVGFACVRVCARVYVCK